jgi:hypothetical protein
VDKIYTKYIEYLLKFNSNSLKYVILVLVKIIVIAPGKLFMSPNQHYKIGNNHLSFKKYNQTTVTNIKSKKLQKTKIISLTQMPIKNIKTSITQMLTLDNSKVIVNVISSKT